MLIISIITVSLATFVSLAVIFQKYNRFANIVCAVGLISTAAVIFGDSMSTIRPEYIMEWKSAVSISEAFMAIAWLLFSLSFARTDYWKGITRFSRLFIYLSPFIFTFFFFVPIEDFFYSPDFATEKVLFLDNTGYIFNLAILFYSILSIINLEATLRSSSGKDRWEIKYFILGVGAILSINIFYYSHALLYRSINMYLLPVKTGIVFIAILLIGVSLFRHRAMDIEFTVSRKIIYRSVSLIIVGGYLLGLGLIGEGMRYFGPVVGKNITAFLGFIGAILVLTIIYSEPLRRKAKVFINKHFFSQKYDYREQWLQFTQRISLKYSFGELLSSIAEGFKHAIGVKGVSIWLNDRDNDEYRCVETLDEGTIEAVPDRELIDFFKKKKWILDVHSDACRDTVSECGMFIQKTEASLIIPLFNINTLEGFIILKDGLEGNEYNFEDYDLLKTLAIQTTVVVLNARLSEELTKAKEMEAMGKLSSFILHDLKNATSMLSLIAQNAEEHIHNPDFQMDAIKAISNTSEKINRIIGKLKNLPKKTSLDLEYSDLGYYVQAAVQQLDVNENSRLSYAENETVKTVFDRKEITKVIINLVMNALDATNNQGTVSVTVGTENNMGYVKVSDNGCGMSDLFVKKHLFKPFETTKKKGLGIGLYQCKTIVEAHSGKIKVISRENSGTDFFLYLPLTAL